MVLSSAKLGNIVAEHCFLVMFCHVSQCGQTRKHFCEKHCFLSMLCDVSLCGQTRKHFCEKHCFLSMFCRVSQCGQTRKHFCEKHCFLSMFCRVSQCGQTRKHFCEKHCFLSMFCHVSQCGQARKHFCEKQWLALLCLLQTCSFVNQCFLCWNRWKHAGNLGNTISAAEMFLNLFGNIFPSREAKFCCGINVSRSG